MTEEEYRKANEYLHTHSKEINASLEESLRDGLIELQKQRNVYQRKNEASSGHTDNS